MPLHLLKLCVGVDSVSDLEAWIRHKLKAQRKRGPREHVHTTRMMPKRSAELLAGGSLYWVIRGEILVPTALARDSRRGRSRWRSPVRLGAGAFGDAG